MNRTIVGTIVAITLAAAVVQAESYRVTVTRKESNLYRIDGTKTYIKTRLCLELALSEPAILNYQRGSYDNKLIFDKRRSRRESCDVEKLLTED